VYSVHFLMFLFRILNRRRVHVYHLAGANMLNRIHECRKDGAVVFNAVPLCMDDDDPERQSLEIDLEFSFLGRICGSVVVPWGG